MPDVSLDLVQTVALGPFNPHIIEPGWLIRQGLCREADFRGYEFLPGADADEQVFRFGDQEWQVDYDRLSVAVRNPKATATANPGDIVASVMERLHHTPVRAVGHNFDFSCGLTEWGSGSLPRLGDTAQPLSAQVTPSRTSWSGAYTRPGGVTTDVVLDVAFEESVVVVLINHNRPTNKLAPEAAQTAARHFADDLRATAQMLGELFGVQWKS